MKKGLIIFISFVFVSVAMSSCRSHERCAAYGKINKIDTDKAFSVKSERSI